MHSKYLASNLFSNFNQQPAFLEETFKIFQSN